MRKANFINFIKNENNREKSIMVSTFHFIFSRKH